MKLPKNSGGGDFTPTPEGQHIGTLVRLIDLGTQTVESSFGIKQQHKIIMGWEVPEERIKWEKDGEEQEGPIIHFERMTLSAHENSILRQRLESWRGRPFTDADFGNFELSTLLGVPALFQISHTTKGDKTYANMTAIMIPPNMKKREDWPKPETEFIHFDLENFNQEVFDKLSEGLQNTIKKSPEYQALFDNKPPVRESENPAEWVEDEIPF